MFISSEHHEKLLDAPWIIRRSDNKTYYMKFQFNEADEYLLLITDLRLVWFEHGNYERMKHNAKVELNMEINNKQAADSLLEKIKYTFAGSATRCLLKREPGHVKVHLPLDAPDQKSEIAVLSWIFDCRVLSQEGEKRGWLSGPEVIFQHFILPSQTIVNYFTENVLDELPEKLRVNKSSSSIFTTNSLEYITGLFRGKSAPNGTSVAQDSIVEHERTDLEEISETLVNKKVQEELERKRELEEFNLRQQQRLPAPKKKKRF